MLLDTFRSGVPDHPQIEWDRDPPESNLRFPTLRTPTERLIHARTGTQVNIYEAEMGYSVQAKLGGYDIDAVVQPDEPGSMVSATTSVLTTDADSMAVARMVAFYYLRGWSYRNATYGEQEGDIRDLGGD